MLLDIYERLSMDDREIARALAAIIPLLSDPQAAREVLEVLRELQAGFSRNAPITQSDPVEAGLVKYLDLYRGQVPCLRNTLAGQ